MYKKGTAHTKYKIRYHDKALIFYHYYSKKTLSIMYEQYLKLVYPATLSQK
jgi:hypothetical protein